MREPEWKVRVERAEAILSRWFYKEGVVQVLDVYRILRAQYHYFVTFKVSATGRGLPTDGYGVITDARNQDEATALAKRVYTTAVDKVTVEWMFEPDKYPMGEIGRHSVLDQGGGEPART